MPFTSRFISLLTMGQLGAESELVEKFRRDVKGKFLSRDLKSHDGAKGHSLEQLFGIAANGKNAPDILGFELKSETAAKTTFGDWSADWYLFSPAVKSMSRHDFIKVFGSPNEKKGFRYSWSGRCFPKVGSVNDFGQTMVVKHDHSVDIVYSFHHDKRPDKWDIVPGQLQKDDLVLAHWSASNLSSKLSRKFGQKGWIKVYADAQGRCSTLAIGDPISYGRWINDVRAGLVFLDSGMYDGNPRPYQSWRANNSYWDHLIVRRYE